MPFCVYKQSHGEALQFHVYMKIAVFHYDEQRDRVNENSRGAYTHYQVSTNSAIDFLLNCATARYEQDAKHL